jgi:hypothetical protein
MCWVVWRDASWCQGSDCHRASLTVAVIEPCDDNRILVRQAGIRDPPSPHEPGLISQRLRFDDGARTDVSRAAVSRSIAGL